MTRGPATAITVAAALAVAGCSPSRQGSDTAALQDSAAVSSVAGAVAAPAAAGATPNGATASPAVASTGGSSVKKASTTSPAGGRAPADTVKSAPTDSGMRAPLPTSPAPGVRVPPGTGTPAFIVFRDSLTAADLDWVRSEGLEIVTSSKGAHSVSVMVPSGYHGNPRSNPRVLRFTIAMR